MVTYVAAIFWNGYARIQRFKYRHDPLDNLARRMLFR